MKDNPVERLNLLEAQLAKCTQNNRKEPIAKPVRINFLLERLEKTKRLSSDPTLLRGEIVSVKREILLRKTHFAKNSIKRFFKQFKKVEPLRIAKRVKGADSETKKTMLEREIIELKDSSIDEWAEEIVKRAISKQFDVEAITGTPFAKRNLNPAEINLFSRIGKAEYVKTAINDLLEAFKKYSEAKDSNGKPTTASGNEKIVDFTKADEKKKKREDFIEVNDEMDQKYTEKKGNDGADPFFEHPDSQYRYDEISDDESEDKKISAGLPLLTQGYISGSEDEENTLENEVQPGRKNRRGQRARRKIWEQKFGQRANHVLKQQREVESERRVKEQKRKCKAERELAAKKQKVDFALRAIHPSWEARQKQKKAMEHVKFEGKKMKFD